METTSSTATPNLSYLPETTPPVESSTNPVLKSILIGFVLLLFGVLIGVLASRFVPATAPVSDEITEPTPEIVEDSTESAVPIIATPTATPSALLELNWKMMTVKSPVSYYYSYRINYPDTWSIKTYTNKPGASNTGSSTLTLVKGDATLNILQASAPVNSPVCSFPGDVLEGNIIKVGDFHGLAKEAESVWRWAPRLESTTTEYIVCGSENSADFIAGTSIGSISLTGEGIDALTLDEFNYILERLVIVK